MRIMAIVVIYSMVYNWEPGDQVGDYLDGGNQDDSDDSGHENSVRAEPPTFIPPP